MKTIELCDQIILAVNSVTVHGEQNMVQLMGIARAARTIKAELSEAERRKASGTEVSGNG